MRPVLLYDRREAHDDQRNQEGTLATDTIAESAEDQGAEGPHGEPCSERGETGKKGGCLVAGRIEQSTKEDR